MSQAINRGRACVEGGGSPNDAVPEAGAPIVSEALVVVLLLVLEWLGIEEEDEHENEDDRRLYGAFPKENRHAFASLFRS